MSAKIYEGAYTQYTQHTQYTQSPEGCHRRLT